MSFPKSVADRALASCNRSCCICHKFCGVKMELHHIKQKADGGEDSFENCIPLCFDCHGDMGSGDPRHPKGKRYSEAELILHRDNWYAACKVNASDVLTKSDFEKFMQEHTATKEDIDKLFAEDVLILNGGNAVGHDSTNYIESGAKLSKTPRIDGATAALEDIAKHIQQICYDEETMCEKVEGKGAGDMSAIYEYEGIGKKQEII